jgi:hypothetical protein
VNFVRFHLLAQGGINHLVPLYRAFTFKCSGHNRGEPVAAVSIERNVLAQEAGGNHVPDLVCSHIINPIKDS